jgi:hypothetical protein
MKNNSYSKHITSCINPFFLKHNVLHYNQIKTFPIKAKGEKPFLEYNIVLHKL